MMKTAGMTRKLKARDQMAWVRQVNAYKAQVEETIFAERVYV